MATPQTAALGHQLLYSPREAGQLLSVSRARVYELIAAGELDSFLHGRKRYIRHETLVAYVDRIEAEAPAGAKAPQPGHRLTAADGTAT